MMPKSAVTASNMATILRPSVNDLTVQLVTQSKEFREKLNFESLMMILCNRLHQLGAIRTGKTGRRPYPCRREVAGAAAFTAALSARQNPDLGRQSPLCRLQGVEMRNPLAFMIAAALTAGAVAAPARAQEYWPAVPPELGVRSPIDRFGGVPYRCDYGPVYNFYHGAYYGGRPPAVFHGYAYRPFYRYTAYRVVPRTYFCDATPSW